MNEHPQGVDRRQFLAGASASALLAALHMPGVSGAGPRPAAPSAMRRTAHRIHGLRLHCAAPQAEMRRFYESVLGLEILDRSSNGLAVRAGASVITFVRSEPGKGGDPFYHFAFNIPENKLLAAREWQLARTEIIPPYESLRDPRYPEDVTHFRSWNAHSVFFWDPAGNLLEYIARHDLDNRVDGAFSSADILYASEIGLVADDVLAMAAQLREVFGLPQYRRGSEQFTAVGDELGLLLVMKRGRMLGFDDGRPAEVFSTAATLAGPSSARYSAPDHPYEIRSA